MSQEVNNADEGDLEIRTERGVRYIIQFPIGDWSGDGHDRCDYFCITSEKSLKDVRKAHYGSLKTLGFNIGDLCKEYGENTLNQKVIRKLKALGYDFGKIDALHGYAKTKENESLYPEKLFDIWLFLLNNIDPSLKLERTKVPSINFYGKDSVGRQLETPGYGLFE